MVPGQERSPSGPEYYPFKFSQEASGDPKRYAFLISGKDEKRISTQGQVLSLFFKHRMKILSQWGYVDDAHHEFVLCLNCDLKNADITPDGIVLELRALKFTKNVRSVRMGNRIFHGFFFPLTLLDNRVMILDSQITFLIQHELKT